MGQFSWLDCIDESQIVDNRTEDVFVLVPAEFGGGHILETCYDGYGRFGGHDIYDLVAEWNRETLSKSMLEKPDRKQYSAGEDGDFYYNMACERYWFSVDRLNEYRKGLSDDEMAEKYGKDWKREIGIDIACYDRQNEALTYPIKITHDAKAIYEDCKPSASDPNQGWLADDEDDEWDLVDDED